MCFGRITDTEPETRDTSCSSAIQITPFVPIKIDLLKTWRFSNFHFHCCLSSSLSVWIFPLSFSSFPALCRASYLLTDLAWHLNPISINKFLLRILMLMCRIFLVNKCFVRFSVFFFTFMYATLSKQKQKQEKKQSQQVQNPVCSASRVFTLFYFRLDKWVGAGGIGILYSNSIVAGGFPVQSYSTLLTPSLRSQSCSSPCPEPPREAQPIRQS